MSVDHRLLATLLVLSSFAMAGCVLPESEPGTVAADEPASADDPASDAAAPDESEAAAPVEAEDEPAEPLNPNMTAEVTQDETNSGICLSGTIYLGQLYCADRFLRIDGTIEDVPDLPVVLSTFNGMIDVLATEDETWSLEAQLSAGGATEDEARDNLEAIDFQWSIEGEDGYALSAIAQTSDSVQVFARQRASLLLQLPSDVAQQLSASTGSGSIRIDGLQGGQAKAQTSSGSISVDNTDNERVNVSTGSGSIYLTEVVTDSLDASAGSGSINLDVVDADNVWASTGSGSINADLRTVFAQFDAGSGSIYATIVPTATGTIDAETGSGTIDLMVPEDDEHGYHVDASTGSGSRFIALEDGNTTEDDDGTHFQSTDFAKRSIQTVLTLGTGSGSIYVNPVEPSDDEEEDPDAFADDITPDDEPGLDLLGSLTEEP